MARKRRRGPRKVRQKAQKCRPRRRAVAFHQGREKIQRNHREYKKAEEKFPGPSPREQALQPGTNEPLKSYVEQREHSNDQQHGRQHARLGDCGAGGHGKHPANRSERREISESIRQPNDVESAEIQRKSKQHAKLVSSNQTGYKNLGYLPETKKSPGKYS